jgi:hypothetical protein
VHVVSVLCDPVQARPLADLLTRETGSLGVRGRTLERWVAAREMGEVDVEGYPVRVKVTAGRVKAEHDDAVRVARQLGRPLREVIARAEQSWREAHPVEVVPTDQSAEVLSLGPWLGDGVASQGTFADPSGHRHGVDLPPDGDAG